MFKILLNFLCERLGETPGQGQAPAPSGQGQAPQGKAGGEGEQGGKAAPEGSQDGTGADGGNGIGAPQNPPQGAGIPKYGRFGDAPSVDDVWKAHQELVGKTSQTEKNFALLRKSLESMGFRAEFDKEAGEFRFMELKKPEAPAKAKRFTDNHKAMFDEPILQAIEARAQDLFEDMFEKYISEYESKGKERQSLVQQKIQAGQKLIKLFPGLKVSTEEAPNAEFNQEFYDRATEIWRENKNYFENPNGELYAAMEAAIELGISPKAIGAAKKEGFVQGTQQKKILGPVDGGGQKGKELKAGALSREQYLALSPEEKEKYDKLSLNIK